MKTKPIIVVVATLIIGFVLGVLTSAQIRYHKLKSVKVFFSEEKFRDGFYRTINPDEQQKTKIDLVLDKYAKINSELQGNFRKEFDASMKDFRKELDSNLTKEQVARLKEMDESRQEMIKQNRRNHESDSSRSRNFSNRHKMEGRPSPDGPMHRPFPEHDTTWLPDNK
jgi:recombinational DNA repair protein RecT